MKNVVGVLLMVLALAVMIVPHFNTCEYNGKLIQLPSGASIPMKCTYSAEAEIAIGIPLFVVGALVVIARRKETLNVLMAMGALLGVIVILIPTNIIGVCSSVMPCNTFMRPFLILMGATTAIISLAWLAFSAMRKEPE